MKKYRINIGWLYPDLMSTYGDRGNIMTLSKRCEWRGIDVMIHEISIKTDAKSLDECDLLFMGGAQDTQQEIVVLDLVKEKGNILKDKIEDAIPGLYICGAYQFLGRYYKTADGKKLPGLSIFPLHTENQGKGKRLIGNVLASPNIREVSQDIVGFENHGGRTYLEEQAMSLATIRTGFGNNGEDGSEGILYKNSIGTYFHGPLLPKNPQIADWLIGQALSKKYGEKFKLEKLDDGQEEKARNQTLRLRFS